MGEYNAGVDDDFPKYSEIDNLHHEESLTTYNQQIRLTYTTTPDTGNETPEGDHTFRVSFSCDPF